jgi:hypothetical protein
MPRGAVALFAVLTMLTVSASAQRSESEIAELFEKTAANVFERGRAKQSKESAALLHDLIVEGASRLVSEKRNSKPEISTAAGIIRRFAGEMVKHGARQPDGTLRLTESSFAAAQRSLCPLYPFC